MKISDINLWDMWSVNAWQEKSIEQWVAAAGDGKLLNESAASRDLREVLKRAPRVEHLERFAKQCLVWKAPPSGHALQDVVNAIGLRLGFQVDFGVYQGTQKNLGLDGLWSIDERHILVEVKMNDAFGLNVSSTAQRLQRLIDSRSLPRERCSVLYVVGQSERGGMEEIRGSSLAWITRLISVEALCHLLLIGSVLDEPADLQKIRAILLPFGYPKVDEIIDLVFAATVSAERESGDSDAAEVPQEEPRAIRSAFHEACIKRIEAKCEMRFIEKGRTRYSSADGSTNVVIAISKSHHRPAGDEFIFAFHPYYEPFLRESMHGYMSFACGSPAEILMVQRDVFLPLLPELSRAQRGHYIVPIARNGNRFVMRRSKGMETDLSSSLI